MTDKDDSMNLNNDRKGHKADDETQFVSNSNSKNRSSYPKKIGQYIIKRVIASGGMGTVFEAMQENPRRPVAIKIIKDAFTSENSIQRLEYEAQLLARLRHPGIAQIYEMGHFEENSIDVPYFAMEYIPNAKSISEYVKHKNLSPDDILCLFQQVCDAVHHGHQRGIVHRDLKPSNILVDSNGRVKIIDFGVAKATDSDMRQLVSHTQVGQIVGSVQYMSPEQFDADPHDIDTRSDIYALGVILYELLSNSLPYKTNSDQIFNFAAEVRKGNLIPLSTKNKHIEKEIEALVHKALNIDREQRYQSAYGLESDIKRYLRGDAISAETLRLSYQLKVFSRKNKLVVGLAAAVLVLLVSGIILTTNLYVKVDKERKLAEKATEQAERGKKFLTDLLSTSANECFGSDFTGEQLLDSASIKIARSFPDNIHIALELRKSISNAYVGLGKFNKAISESEKAFNLIRDSFDINNDKMLEAYDNLSFAYNISGRYSDKLKIEREYLEKVIKVYGENSLETYSTKYYTVNDLDRNGFISEANQMAKDAYEGFVSEYGENDISTLSAQFRYASILLKTGEMDEAKKLIFDAYKKINKQFNENHDMFDVARYNLAMLYIIEAKIDSAKALYGNRRVPNSFDFEMVFNGEDNYGKNPFQLLVFFEEWCPYSKNALNALGKVDLHYNELGLDVIGITRCSKNSTIEDIPPFLKKLDIDFTVYKDNGSCSNIFEINSFPSLRLVADGYIILESTGYSSNSMTPQMLDGIVTAMKSTPFRKGDLENP